MTVYTAWRPGTDLMDIWIYRDTFAAGPRQQVKVVGPDLFENVEVAEGDRPDPSLSLPSDLFGALITAGSDILPPSAATERHLADAIKVRDRLLDKVVPAK